MLTKERLQALYRELLSNHPAGISSTSTKKFDPTREYLANELGITNNDIYITGSGTRAGNLEVRLSQGQQAKQHTILGVAYLSDEVGTDENVLKLTSSAFTTAEKYVGASGKSEYDIILVVVIRDRDLFVTGIMYLDKSRIAQKIINDFPNIDKRPIATKIHPESHSVSSQKIFFGCPGTGKSHKVQGLTEGEDGEKIVYFDENGAYIDDIDSVEDKSKVTTNIFRTTFHPDYDYSTFVGSYKPVMNPVLDEDGNETDKEELVYEFVPQVFTNAYVRAYKSLADTSLPENKKNVYLIIEEINRGNCAQIFGDLFQLLDRKNGVSEFSIIPDAELRKYLAKEGLESNKLALPSNLHILATMNTSDQSLFPMDSAFKRRWEMEYVPINLEQEKAAKFTFQVNGLDYSWVEFLAKVNPLIRKATDSEDKQMGEFFIKGNVTEDEFKNKVMFYIWNDVCKDLYSASRISPLFFMRSAEGDNRKDVFTFAELYGTGRYNEEDNDYTKPVDLLEGFITKYLKLTAKSAATPIEE